MTCKQVDMKILTLLHLEGATLTMKSAFILDALNDDLTIFIDLYLNLTYALFLGKDLDVRISMSFFRTSTILIK